MSYADLDGVPSQTAGTSSLLASDWNTYVRDNFDSIKFGHVVVADNTAKSAISAVEGIMVYQSDVDTLFLYNGTAWVSAIGTVSLVDLAVTTAKIADLNVTTGKIAAANVTGAKIESSVALAANPTTTTQADTDNSTRLATTAYVNSSYSPGRVLATGGFGSQPSQAQNVETAITLTGNTTFTVPFTGARVRISAVGMITYASGTGSPATWSVAYRFRKLASDGFSAPDDGYNGWLVAGSANSQWNIGNSWTSGALTASTTYTVGIAMATGNSPFVITGYGGSFTVELI